MALSIDKPNGHWFEAEQVALKHVIHDMVTRTLVMELRRCAIERWVPSGDMDRRLKIPHSAKVECGFWILPRNAYLIAV